MIFFYYFVFLALCFFTLEKYIKFAENKNILAFSNNKTLHKGKIPRGAGIVFGLIYVLFLFVAFLEDYISFSIFFPILIGSLSCLILGFIDDIYDLNILTKFVFQFLIILSSVLFILNISSLFNNINFLYIFVLLTTFCGVWMLNAYNFLDGADGHLSSVSLMQCLLLLVSLYANDKTELSLPIFFLLSVTLIFIKYNWQPAKVFMGDSGSLFIGINFIIYILFILKLSLIDYYVLIIIFSYYLIDTLGTFSIRIFLRKSFKQRHISHPYQKFSGLYSHKKMSQFVIIYHLVWLLPLVLLCNFFPVYQIYFTFLSLLPSIVFLIKFGPLSSQD